MLEMFPITMPDLCSLPAKTRARESISRLCQAALLSLPLLASLAILLEEQQLLQVLELQDLVLQVLELQDLVLQALLQF